MSFIKNPNKTLEEMEAEVLEINQANGWFEEDRTVGDDIALLHSEVSEALESFRDTGLEDGTKSIKMTAWTQVDARGRGVIQNIQDNIQAEMLHVDPFHVISDEENEMLVYSGVLKPEGFGSELADVLIRLLDTCARRGVNLREEYERKIAFNRTRGHRHGGKAL